MVSQYVGWLVECCALSECDPCVMKVFCSSTPPVAYPIDSLIEGVK